MRYFRIFFPSLWSQSEMKLLSVGLEASLGRRAKALRSLIMGGTGSAAIDVQFGLLLR